MTFKYVNIEIGARLAVVHIRREEARNALNVDLIGELHEAARTLHSAAHVDAIVLTGTPKCFSAGADRKDDRIFRAATHALDHWHLVEGGTEAARAWEELRQPTFAAIEGFAVGGGFTFAMACDFRVMGQGAFIQVPEVSLGFNYGWNSIPRLVSLIGPSRTKEMVIFGDRVEASLALSWGMVDRVVDDGLALQTAVQWASRVIALPQMAVQFTKRAVNAVSNSHRDIGSHADMAQILLCLKTAAEGK